MEQNSLGKIEHISDGNIEHIPLDIIKINPHILGNDKYEPLLFVCNKGIKSCIAAGYAKNAGYKNIFYSSLD